MTTKFITGAQTRIAYVAEVTNGTTPATPTTIELPTVKLDLELVQSTYKDQTIYSDRMSRDVIAGLKKVSGSFTGDFSHTNFNAIITTAMFSTASSKVFTTGTTLQTITLEEWHPDATVPFGYVYTGCFADKLQFKLPVNNVATIDATINGFNSTFGTTQLNSSPTAAAVEVPFVATTATMKEGGSTVAIITSVDISINNSAQAQDVIGSVTPVNYTPGMSSVTGTMTCYVADTSLYEKFVNQSATSVEISLTDGTNTVDILLPRVFYTSAKKPVQGNAGLIMTFAFEAVRDPSLGTNFQLTYS